MPKITQTIRRLTLMAASVLLVLCYCARAFTGEAAATNALLNLLARKDFSGMGEKFMEYLTGLCRQNFVNLLLINPEPLTPSMLGVTRYIIGFLQPVFVFIILLSSIYLIFFSGSPGVRTKVKAMLPATVAAMILAGLSSHLLNILYYVSKQISNQVVANLNTNPADVLLPVNHKINPANYFMSHFSNLTWYSSDAAIPFLLIPLILIAALFAVMLARYLLLSLFTIIFPLTITMYLFPITRAIGRRLMEQTIVWTFLQVIEAVTLLCIVTTIKASAHLATADVLMLMGLSGLIILIAVPVTAVTHFRNFLP